VKHQSVQSSNIQSVGYDLEKKILQVKFHSGQAWNYHGVSAAKHQQLLQAESLGGFLHSSIKPFHSSEVAS
jgi:hypothetical protein